MAYPDNYSNLPNFTDKNLATGEIGTPLDASNLNPRAQSINAIEQTLGLNPEGNQSTVAERLTTITNQGIILSILF